jgi:NADH-quinone oxidoreductase subunit E
MSFTVPKDLESEIDELISHYLQKRSAALMVLHALQDRFGWLSREAIEWSARKLDLQPINIFELVTFYPMFRQEPAGRNVLKVCRTLSCALAGSGALHKHVCSKLGLATDKHGLQTTRTGSFPWNLSNAWPVVGLGPS